MSENVKVNYYSVVPAEVKYNNELTERAKLIYGKISSLSNKMGDCLAMLVKENVGHLLYKINRDQIISLYDECKLRENEYKACLSMCLCDAYCITILPLEKFYQKNFL